MSRKRFTFVAPVLVTESLESFEAFANEMMDYIKPNGIIEETLVHDVIDTTWHIMRLQRSRSAMINIAYPEAIKKLLDEELSVVDEFQADHLAQNWLILPAVKQEVLKALKRFGLDEIAIEAQAMAILASDLEAHDRTLTSLEARRNKTLRLLAEIQANVASRTRKMLDTIDSNADHARSKAAE